MQKYIYIRSPLKAAQLVEAGFSYMKAPFASNNQMFIFAYDESMMPILHSDFAVGEDYVIRDGALLAF